MIYIYALVTDEIKYVGVTKNPTIRKSDHMRNKPSHKFVILETVSTAEDATKREQELIEEHDTYFSGWNKTPGGEYANNSGYERKGIGGTKKGSIPWNKGKTNCFSDETIQRMKEVRSGKIHSSKLTKQKVREIRERYHGHPSIKGVGEKQPNGRVLTKERAFANLYSEDYDISSVNLYNIVSGKSWHNI